MKIGKKKDSDSGMTLIEVIVAVSIFAITAAVLLQSFVTSSRINKKSRIYLEATTVAQNIMEEVKSKDFAEVSLAFNYPLYRDISTGKTAMRLSFLTPQINEYTNGTMLVKEVLPTSGGLYTPVRLYNKDSDSTFTDNELASIVTASVISRDNGITYKFNPRKKGTDSSKYYFELTNIKSGTDSNESYDALVEFDGSQSSGYKNSNTIQGGMKNDYAIPNIIKLDTKTDALIALKENQYFKEFSEQFSDVRDENDEPLTEDIIKDIYENSEKKVVIKLEKESSGVVNVAEDYTITSSRYLTDPIKVSVTSVFRAEADSELKNVCIFYYPNYNSTNSTKPLDIIEFENKNNYPVNLYVVKQKTEDPYLFRKEYSYKMRLTVTEDTTNQKNHSNWYTNPSLYPGVTKLRTNLGWNIGSEETEQRQAVNNQVNLIYKDLKGNVVKNAGAIKVLDANTLDAKEVKDRIYKAKVKIYKCGAAVRGFPEDDLVVTLDGAKEN